MDEKIEISIVVPVYNEEDNVGILFGNICEVMEAMGKKYEIVFVDDGSTDKTFHVLKEMKKSDLLKIIRFRKNFGQTAAIAAGFDYSVGDVIVTMDGDLQNDPKDIPLLLENIDKGYDVVSGWREKRKDPFFSKKIPSLFSNWLARRLTNVDIHDFGCTLKAYRREALQGIRLFGEMHRYIPAIMFWNGSSLKEIWVKHNPRLHGKTKYGNQRLVKGFLDLIFITFLTKYSTRPNHFFGFLGFLQFFVGIILGLYLTIDKLLFGARLSERPMLLLAILLILTGIQFVTLGFLGEMLLRIYYGDERRIYNIKEIL